MHFVLWALVPWVDKRVWNFLGLPTTKLMSESLILSLHFHPFFVCIGFVLLNGEQEKFLCFSSKRLLLHFLKLKVVSLHFQALNWRRDVNNSPLILQTHCVKKALKNGHSQALELAVATKFMRVPVLPTATFLVHSLSKKGQKVRETTPQMLCPL